MIRFPPISLLSLILVFGVPGTLIDAHGAEDSDYEIVGKELLKEDDEDEETPAQPRDNTPDDPTLEEEELVPAEPLTTPDTDTDDAATETLNAAYTALQNHEYDVAYDLFSSLAAQDNAQAQYELAALYHRGAGVDADVARAARWYARAAEQDYAEAQYRLGNMYLMGEGVRQSDTEAAHWHEKAAQQGHKDAKDNLASLRRISSAKTRQELEQEAATLPPLEVRREPEDQKPGAGKKAKKRGFFKRWFGKDDKPQPKPDNNTAQPAPQPTPTETADTPAALTPAAGPSTPPPAPLANSTAVSSYELGLAYALGDTLEQDDEKAFTYFSRAAQEGYAPAQYRLGVAYADGDGTPPDPAQALEWYNKAAKQGHIDAQRSLALIYLNGQGQIPPDKPKALAWYTILAEDGNQLDVHRRDGLLEELPEQDVAKAESLADEIRAEISGTQ